MTEAETFKCITTLMAYFPTSGKMETPTMKLWAEPLAGYDYQTTIGAIKKIGQTQEDKFLPSLASLLRAVYNSHACMETSARLEYERKKFPEHVRRENLKRIGQIISEIPDEPRALPAPKGEGK